MSETFISLFKCERCGRDIKSGEGNACYDFTKDGSKTGFHYFHKKCDTKQYRFWKGL